MFNSKLFRAKLTLAYFSCGGESLNDNLEEYLDCFVYDFVDYMSYQDECKDADCTHTEHSEDCREDEDDEYDDDDGEYDDDDGEELDYYDDYDQDYYGTEVPMPVKYGKVPLCSIQNVLVVEGYVVEFDYHDSTRYGKVIAINQKGDHTVLTLQENDFVKNYDSRKISNLKVIYQALSHQ